VKYVSHSRYRTIPYVDKLSHFFDVNLDLCAMNTMLVRRETNRTTKSKQVRRSVILLARKPCFARLSFSSPMSHSRSPEIGWYLVAVWCSIPNITQAETEDLAMGLRFNVMTQDTDHRDVRR
jgi:hypothetical protein